jgi:hypothetical protein
MSSIIENDKLKNRNQQQSNSGSTPTTATTSATQTLKKGQGNNNNTREEGEGPRTKRRPTKVSLNDTLRRIRYLMVEGWSNLEIQIYYSLKSASFIDI